MADAYANRYAILQSLPGKSPPLPPPHSDAPKRKNKSKKKKQKPRVVEELDLATQESIQTVEVLDLGQATPSVELTTPRSPVRLLRTRAIKTEQPRPLLQTNLGPVQHPLAGWRPAFRRGRSQSEPPSFKDIRLISKGVEPLMYSLTVGEAIQNIGKSTPRSVPMQRTPKRRLQMPRTPRTSPKFQIDAPSPIRAHQRPPTLRLSKEHLYSERRTPSLVSPGGTEETIGPITPLSAYYQPPDNEMIPMGYFDYSAWLDYMEWWSMGAMQYGEHAMAPHWHVEDSPTRSPSLRGRDSLSSSRGGRFEPRHSYGSSRQSSDGWRSTDTQRQRGRGRGGRGFSTNRGRGTPRAISLGWD